jgi:hypothetical protein
MDQLNATITNLLNIATGIGLLTCAFFMCVAGFHFMTGGGSPSAAEKAKTAAFNAAVGFGLVLSASIINTAIVR